MNYQKYIDYLVEWIIKKVNKADAKGVILGLSGGIDSAVVACLAKRAFPQNSLSIILQIDNMDKDIVDIKKLVDQINIDHQFVDLKKTFNQITKSLKINKKESISNIKPRLRMTSLYAIAQEHRYLVLGTDNKIEWEIGYFTKYGDGGVDLLPIVNLLKSDVKNIAKLLNVPDSIINKTPSAGLWEGQTDENELGFTYQEADKYFSGKPVLKKTKIKIQHLNKITMHKRNSIPKPLKIEEI